MTLKRPVPTHVAVDLGASNGRVLLSRFDGSAVEIEEVHRFANVQLQLPDGPHWNVPFLMIEILAGLKAAASRGEKIGSVGLDTWGVDLGLLDAQGMLTGPPYAYRHPRTEGS